MVDISEGLKWFMTPASKRARAERGSWRWWLWDNPFLRLVGRIWPHLSLLFLGITFIIFALGGVMTLAFGPIAATLISMIGFGLGAFLTAGMVVSSVYKLFQSLAGLDPFTKDDPLWRRLAMGACDIVGLSAGTLGCALVVALGACFFIPGAQPVALIIGAIIPFCFGTSFVFGIGGILSRIPAIARVRKAKEESKGGKLSVWEHIKLWFEHASFPAFNMFLSAGAVLSIVSTLIPGSIAIFGGFSVANIPIFGSFLSGISFSFTGFGVGNGFLSMLGVGYLLETARGVIADLKGGLWKDIKSVFSVGKIDDHEYTVLATKYDPRKDDSCVKVEEIYSSDDDVEEDSDRHNTVPNPFPSRK